MQVVDRHDNVTSGEARVQTCADGGAVDISHTEFGILRFLAARPGGVFTRRQILHGVHGEDHPVLDRSIDVQIAALRKKLGARGDLIETRITIVAVDGTVLGDSDETSDRMDNHGQREEISEARGRTFPEVVRNAALQDFVARAFHADAPMEDDQAIIEDLLCLSRLEQGTGETVTVDCPHGLKTRLDPPLLEQAVVNLIDNAVKYGPENDEIEVTAETVLDHVLISVRDHGRGIEARHLPLLYR